MTLLSVGEIFLRNVAHAVTMDPSLGELSGVDILIRGNRIAAIGAKIRPPAQAEVVDGRGLLVLPGLINAHNHLYQVGFRCLPDLERSDIIQWLRRLHVLTSAWYAEGRFSADFVRAMARAGMVESLLGGVTTIADQHYVFPAGLTHPYIEATIEAAHETGIRLHAGRGTMTYGRSEGGAAPDEVCQSIGEVIRHSEKLIDRFHDPDPFARIRIDLAPCGVHTDKLETYREFAALAADTPGVGLHTHLYEVVDTAFCRERYGRTPWEVVRDAGWNNDRVWFAHMVDTPVEEIPEIAAAGVGVAHLIAPDLRMGFGLAPLREYLDAGCTVGFGTTGSASNDGCNQLGDLRLAALAHRLRSPDPQHWPSTRELLEMSTRGSASCLSRPELGVLAPGKAADLAAWRIDGVDRVGVHDHVAGLLLAGLSDRASLVVVDGRILVRDGRCTLIEEEKVAEQARDALQALGNVG